MADIVQDQRTVLPPRDDAVPATTRLRALPVLVTLIAVGLAALLGWAAWQAYVVAPWTRDGAVRAYVVTIAPEVSGRITSLPVEDNQFVHKGDVLLTIDQTDYAIALAQAQAVADQAQANAQNTAREAARRSALSTLETSEEEKQTYITNAASAQAALRQAAASLARARINLERTTVHAPVNGYVTNLLAQQGDYANTGQNLISVVNSDSYWVDGYFEETQLHAIHPGDPATVKLMGYRQVLHGHVASIARGTSLQNVQAGSSGLAAVNPIFTWVRLAQRVPVRIAIDQVPDGMVLVAGETASVQIDADRGGPPAGESHAVP